MKNSKHKAKDKSMKDKIERPFRASQFKATKFTTAEEKAKFANMLVVWIQKGFPPGGWTKFLYHGLSQHMYSHIAHYDSNGFYNVWFANVQKQLNWIEYAIHRYTDFRIFGDPHYTWSD